MSWFSKEAIDDRTHSILNGFWGDSKQIRRRATQWYQDLGIETAAVLDGSLHPIVEYAANCAYLDETPAVPTDQFAAAPPKVSFSGGLPQAWEFTASTEDNALRELIAGRLTDGWEIRPTSPVHMAAMKQAVNLVVEAAPLLGADALSYTRRHVIVKTDRMIGRTWVDLGGVTVSGDPAFQSVSQLAESLYHEALHSKYYTIERGLKFPTPDEATSPKPVPIPWQQDSSGTPQRWTAHRSLDAYYVYVHLSVFRLALFALTRSTEDLDRLRRVCFRTAYLSRQIEAACRGYLDDERLGIAEWLDACRVPEFDLNPAGQALLDQARVSVP